MNKKISNALVTSLILGLSFFSVAHAAAKRDLPTVESVDFNRYVGKWYAISALPQTFTRSCEAQTAEYQAVGKDAVSVVNTCIKSKGESTIKGTAQLVNPNVPSKLKVKFDTWWSRAFNIQGDYYILKLDNDYQYVLVGSPNLKSLWILSRKTTMDENAYNEYVDYARKLGFKVDRLQKSTFRP